MDISTFWFVGLSSILFLVIHANFVVPPHLRHLPRVPVLPLVWSYVAGEPEGDRFRRLLLPFLSERGEGVVLVWALGRWMVHILDAKLARTMSDNIQQFPKEQPPDDLLLWSLIGRTNMLQANGDTWKKHSRIVRGALINNLPIDMFVTLSRKVFAVIGDGGRICWDNIAQRYALDAVGASVLGHDFDAITGESEFVQEYNGIMHDIANPAYLILPFLEKVFPRRQVIERIENLVKSFNRLLDQKRQDPGEDIMTFMLRDPAMTETELRDNMILLFIAGHDTSAGGLSSLVYFLARHPDIQEKARQEVLTVMGPSAEPDVEILQKMSYVNACVREALRINTPISYLVPRAAVTSASLGKYEIPAGSSLIFNLYVIHHHEGYFHDPYQFSPNRFLDKNQAEAGMDEAWLPFGKGPRQCPARNFALYEQRCLIVMLLREYRWALPEDSAHKVKLQNAFSPFALAVPSNLDIIFTKLR